MNSPDDAALYATARELAARVLDDGLPLDQARAEAARLAGDVFDAAKRDEREARHV